MNRNSSQMNSSFTTGYLSTDESLGHMLKIEGARYRAVHPEASEHKVNNHLNVVTQKAWSEQDVVNQGKANIVYPAVFDQNGKLVGWSCVKHDANNNHVSVNGYRVMPGQEDAHDHLTDHTFNVCQGFGSQTWDMVTATGDQVSFEHLMHTKRTITNTPEDLRMHLVKNVPGATVKIK